VRPPRSPAAGTPGEGHTPHAGVTRSNSASRTSAPSGTSSRHWRASASGDEFAQPLDVGGDPVDGGAHRFFPFGREGGEDPAAQQSGHRYVELGG